MIQLTLEGAARSLDISSDTQLFRATCTSWPQYQPGINDLTITHVRKCVAPHIYTTFEGVPNKKSISYDLPDDVFQPGEQKPTRPKKKITKRVVSAAQKRPIDAVDVSTCLGTTANSVTASKICFFPG